MSSGLGCAAAIVAEEAEPDFVALEMQAVVSLVVDLIAAQAATAPQSLDRTLQIARLRLQQLDHQRLEPAVEHEATILRFKVNMLERGLGRAPTQA